LRTLSRIERNSRDVIILVFLQNRGKCRLFPSHEIIGTCCVGACNREVRMRMHCKFHPSRAFHAGNMLPSSAGRDGIPRSPRQELARLDESRQPRQELCKAAHPDLQLTNDPYVLDNSAPETRRRFDGLSAVFDPRDIPRPKRARCDHWVALPRSFSPPTILLTTVLCRRPRSPPLRRGIIPCASCLPQRNHPIPEPSSPPLTKLPP
jgi:hypothetical protein